MTEELVYLTVLDGIGKYAVSLKDAKLAFKLCSTDTGEFINSTDTTCNILTRHQVDKLMLALSLPNKETVTGKECELAFIFRDLVESFNIPTMRFVESRYLEETYVNCYVEVEALYKWAADVKKELMRPLNA